MPLGKAPVWARLTCFAAAAVPGVELLVVHQFEHVEAGVTSQRALKQRRRGWATSAIWNLNKEDFSLLGQTGTLRFEGQNSKKLTFKVNWNIINCR